MYVDVKVTVWQRIQLNEEDGVTLNEIKNTIENEGVNALWDRKDCDISWETILETEEYMSVSENGGCSTVEIYDDDGNLLWENAEI
jgi:hypothetical protein